MKANIDHCIKCSICNAYCPVLKATGLFPGPKLAGPDAERFRRRREELPPQWLALCDYCKICERVCPHHVPLSELHMRSCMDWRKTASLRNWLLGHSHLLAKLGSFGVPLSNWLAGRTLSRWLLERELGIGRQAPVPSFRRPTFRGWFRSRQGVTEGEPVAYFHGCHTDSIDPEVGIAVVEVLEKNGFQVLLPDQECCGLPLMANGLFEQTKSMARKNIRSLGKCVEAGGEVVYSSTSCGMTLGREYEGLLGLPGASALADHLFEISQFLLQLHEEGRLQESFRPRHETIYYHAPCHLRALQIGLPALDLLSLIPGLKVIELPEACCGLAGTFGYKKENAELAVEIGRDLFQEIRSREAKIVISDCEACRLQISRHTGVRTAHPIQILRQAYGE